jgi:hypothetical protein
MKPIGTSEKDERCKRKMELMALNGCQHGDIFVTFQNDLPGFYSLGEKPKNILSKTSL